MADPSDQLGTHDTRLRLIAAAGEVFAEHGFEQATVRDICANAQANVASVKYHFGGKTELYRATMRHYVADGIAKYPTDMGLPPNPTPTDRLGAFVRSMIHRVLDEGAEAIHGRLMAWEMIRPTPALDDHVEEVVRPMSALLRGIIVGINPALTEEQIRHASGSVIGQVLFYKHCRPVMDKLFPGQPCGAEDFEKVAQHITRFSLRGLGNADA